VNCLSITEEGLGRAFTATLLLTASVAQAEASVLAGVEAMNQLRVSDEALFLESITASIAMELREDRENDHGGASSLLPPQLRAVLRLPRELRRGFVLRLLFGLPREICASILRTCPSRVDEILLDAAEALAERKYAE
jgi:hypothetical protein